MGLGQQDAKRFIRPLTEVIHHSFNRTSFGNQILRHSNPKPMKIIAGKKFSQDKSVFASYYIHPKGLDDDYTKYATLEMTLNFKNKPWKHLLNLCTCGVNVSVTAYEGHPEDEPAISLGGMLEPTIKVLDENEKHTLRAHIRVKRVIDLTKLWQSTTCRKDINIKITTELDIKQDVPDVRVELITEDNVDSELVVISHQLPR